MRKPARKHHYIPQGYLAGFTDTGTKKGKLYVLDTKTGNGFKSALENVAAERDFNRVDLEGEDLDKLEQAMSAFEDDAIVALRRTARTNAFPTDNDFNYLINLLGLFAIRNPQLRESMNRSREQVVHLIGNLLVSDEKIWEHHIKKARQAGEQIPEGVSFQEVKRFIENEDYTVEFGTEMNIKAEFQTFDKLLPFLARRLWSLIIVDDGAPDFVCADHPVSIVWKDRTLEGPIGFGLRQTEVFFPLNRRQALFGVFEDPQPVVQRVDIHKVGELNARTVENARRQVYYATESFVMLYQGQLVEVKGKSTRRI